MERLFSIRLNWKPSILFQVTGDTIYNMVKLSETETDAQERPINPHYIKTTTVLNNPFDDIKPRNAEAQPKKDKVKDPNKKKKSKGMLFTEILFIESMRSSKSAWIILVITWNSKSS